MLCRVAMTSDVTRAIFQFRPICAPMYKWAKCPFFMFLLVEGVLRANMCAFYGGAGYTDS
jgi:hypothetical protein